MKNIGLIGCGSRLRGVIRNLLTTSDELKVTALCDTSQQSIDKAKEIFGPATTVYADHHELARDAKVDWVAIGSWNAFHRDHIVAALEAGKDVFTEKPMAINAVECLDIKKAVEASGKQVVIGFTLRYSPHYSKIKEIIDRGDIGQVISFEFNETLDFNHGGFIHADWRRLIKNAGTHLLEKCCHDLDIANWIIGSIPKKVASFGGLDFFTPENKKHMERLGKNSEGDQAYQAWPRVTDCDPFTSDKDIVDNQVAIIEYMNGVRATFHTNCNAGLPERRMYILGTEGAIRAEAREGLLELKRIGFDTKLIDEATGAKGDHGGGDNLLTESLKECILNGAPSATPFTDGITATISANAIDRAMNEGGVVDLTEDWKKAGVI